ncbi:MAG: hypothetical protein WD097_10600 [Balneolales bacterium]
MNAFTDKPETILYDAAYLAEELNALKRVISAVPYQERPYGQESIRDMLVSIGLKQEKEFKPLVLSKTNIKRNSKENSEELEAQKNYSEDKSIEEIIDRISAERTSLIRSLENREEDLLKTTFEYRGSIMTLYAIIEQMVQYDVKQLKQVAERVMAIDMERNIRSDISQ